MQRRERAELVKISEVDLRKLDDEKNLAIEYVKAEQRMYQMQNIALQIERQQANTLQIEIDTKLKKAKEQKNKAQKQI